VIVTVAICTWNRCVSLARTLDGLAQQQIPRDTELDVLVVNNNCTDATNQTVDAFGGTLRVRRIFEATPGLSHARNAAVAGAAGDYILWIDDDVLVQPGWLGAYRTAMDEHPDAAVFGGPIEPQFEGTPPAWLLEVLPYVANAYASRALGDQAQAFDVTVGRIPFGANYGVRTSVQRQYTYDATLGRRPQNVHGVGEETAVVSAILRAGQSGWWIPGARVHHTVPQSRQSLGYLRRYFANLGRIDAREEIGPSISTVLGHPRWLWRQAMEAEMRYRYGRIARRPSTWIVDFIAASRLWGRLLERRSEARGR
jgi:hypothetical protein